MHKRTLTHPSNLNRWIIPAQMLHFYNLLVFDRYEDIKQHMARYSYVYMYVYIDLRWFSW